MPKNNIVIAAAIVIAGALIAGSLYFSNGSDTNTPSGNNTSSESNVRTVQKDDYIRGDKDAAIVVIEYSDLECPFCKRFHNTMKTILEEYEGQVAWVYRHFPIPQLHPNAPLLAEASECVGHLGNNDTFWDFVDGIFAQAPEGELYPLDELDTLVSEVGIDVEDFNACLDDGTYTNLVEEDFNEVVQNGGRGTPHNVLLVNGKDQVIVEGAQPIESLRAIIDGILEDE